MPALVLHIALLGFASSANSGTYDTNGSFAGSYLCIPDASGGVFFNGEYNRWEGGVFNTQNKKIIISVTAISQITAKDWTNTVDETAMSYAIRVTEFGDTSSDCNKIPREPLTIAVNGFFSCKNSGFEYLVNLGTLRFMEIYTLGYVGGEDNPKLKPGITVGKCTKF